MPKSHHRKRGGNNNPNLPYSQQVKYGGGPYSSASTYGSYVNGSGDSQYNRVFSLNSPDASNPSNNIVGVQGQNMTNAYTPNAQQLSLIQSAGSKYRTMSRSRTSGRTRSRSSGRSRGRSRSRSNSRTRRGGNFGTILNQAVVPFSLLALQQTYRRKGKKSSKKSTKRRF